MDNDKKPEGASGIEESFNGVTVNADVSFEAKEEKAVSGDVPADKADQAAEAKKSSLSDEPIETAPAVTSADVKKGGKGKVFAIVIIVLLLAAGGVGAYFVMNGGNGGTANNTEPDDVVANEYEEYTIDGEKISDFDISFLKFHNEKENKIYSPLSIKYALSMLADGADGDSKSQIDNILGTYSAKKYINSANLSLANGMFVRTSLKENVLEKYVSGISEKYNAEVVYDDFANATNINNWVKGRTLNLIGDLVTDGDVVEDDFYLINALVVDMEWKHWIQRSVSDKGEINGLAYEPIYAHIKSFDSSNDFYHDRIDLYERDSSTVTFNSDDGISGATFKVSIDNYDIVEDKGEDNIRKTVKEAYEKWLKTEESKDFIDKMPNEEEIDAYIDEYMEQLDKSYKDVSISTDFKYYVDEDVKVFAKELKEYGGSTLQYVAIMPKSEGLDEYVKGVDAEKISGLIGDLKELTLKDSKEGAITHIVGSVPMFKFDYSLKLAEDLGKMGITDVFDAEKANLSNMVNREGTYIKRAKHKAEIDFSNEGIRAAAATAFAGGGNGDGGFEYLWDAPIEEIDLSFDKPFMFIIRDIKSGEVWFSGTVYEPTKIK